VQFDSIRSSAQQGSSQERGARAGGGVPKRGTIPLTTRPAMLVVAFGVGMGAGSAFAVIGLLVAKLFGEASFGRAMGLFQLLVVPFNFGAPLLAGSLYDWSGAYKLSLAIHMLSYAVAAGIFLLTARHTSSPRH
jgi:hypothetical protein